MYETNRLLVAGPVGAGQEGVTIDASAVSSSIGESTGKELIATFRGSVSQSASASGANSAASERGAPATSRAVEAETRSASTANSALPTATAHDATALPMRHVRQATAKSTRPTTVIAGTWLSSSSVSTGGDAGGGGALGGVEGGAG